MTLSPMTENPREAGAKPPFPQESLEYPGLESEMTPRPDYGEASYQGHGRPQGKVALITGGDSGIGRGPARPLAPGGGAGRGAGVRAGGRRCPDLLSERGLRCRGDGTGRTRGGPEGGTGARRH